jgi:saxitoxin biosynthesis operon SxtJ-like protein
LTSGHADLTANASDRDLRKFGLSTGTAFALILGLLLPWLFGRPIPVWPFGLGAVLIGPALLFPRVLRPIHRGWMAFAEKLGAFNARIILGAAFYGILTPTGFIRRLLGYDPLALRTARSESFRKPSRQRDRKSMERPF